MTKVMMILGSFPFMLATAPYTNSSRRAEYRWQAVDRLGRKPAQQFLGPGAGEITLQGEILPDFAGGLGQLDAMRAIAATGQPQRLVSGRGEVLGQWVITQIEEQGSEFRSDGSPRVMGFSVTLREYGGDRAGGGAIASVISAISALARLL